MLRVGRYHFTDRNSILMGVSAAPRASAVCGFFSTPLDWLMLAVPAAFAIRFCASLEQRR